MRMVYAFLAEAAEISPAGKFSVLSGGIETLTVSALPAVLPTLSLIVRLGVEDSDIGAAHRFHVELLDPGGTDIFPAQPEVEFTPQSAPEGLGLPSSHLLALRFPWLTFQSQGLYTFRLLVDGNEIGTIPVRLILEPAASNPATEGRRSNDGN